MNPHDLRTSRYADLDGVDELAALPIHVMGTGSVGRSLSIALATMGAHNLSIFDPDVVEAENTGTQGFSSMVIGQSKVEATSLAMSHCNPEVTVRPHQIIRPVVRPGPCDVLFVCIDNMNGRINLGCHVHSLPANLLVDTRIGGLTARIIADTPNFDVWKSTLFPESEMAQAPCALRMTHFTALLAAGWALSALFNWFRDGDDYKPVDFIHNTMDYSLIRSSQPPKRRRSDYFSGCFPFRKLLTEEAIHDSHATFDLPLPASDLVGSGRLPRPTEDALQAGTAIHAALEREET